MRNILVTGGAGFIGSNFVHYVLRKHPRSHVIAYDKLTYAGNLDNLEDVADDSRYTFVWGDICDEENVDHVMRAYRVDTVVNFAAETHVDRSLTEAGSFVHTDTYGTYVLLEAARKYHVERFHQVGTDEVYGEVMNGSAAEGWPLEPRSPYSASKAGGDLMCLAYSTSFGLPVTITRCTNNIGPYQYPEKVVPLFITNAIDDQPLPVYGDGTQMRDYQFVLDHCEAIDLVLTQGRPGEVYNVGTGVETRNIDIARMILRLLGKPESLIHHVTDRPGHDRRYSVDSEKIRALGWAGRHSTEQALEKTVRWYLENEWWWRKIKSGAFRAYYQKQYTDRLAHLSNI
ncbi:MAG: dTDP-glucose 4,6-dehydratase [Anaerolineae bacterium]|nr:dTDP-glucose 4,6-dehydratase [Anaerolineae bacterium]